MFRLILAVILLVAAAILALIGVIKDPRGRSGNDINLRRWVPLVAVGGVVILAWSCIRVIPANSVGIPTTFGSIGSPVSPGLKIVLPFTEISTFSTRLQESTMIADTTEGDRRRDDSVEVRGSDGYSMKVDLTIRYSVRREAASALYRRVGDLVGVRDRIVRPETREAVRIVFSKYTAEEGYSGKREQISADMNELMRRRLAPYGLDLDQVNLRNVNPEESLRRAIGARADAREAALKEKIVQEQAVTAAEGRKQVAERDAAALQVSSQAQADANAKVSASLTPAILESKRIEALGKANTIYVPNNAIVDARQNPGGAPVKP